MEKIIKAVKIKSMKKYYALLDMQINQIVSAGLNSRTKKNVRNSLINFLLLGNFSEEGERSLKNNSLAELMNYYGFKLQESKSSFKN